MAVGSIYRVTMAGVVGTDDMQVVHHFRTSSGGGSSAQEAQSLADAFWDDTGPEWLAMLSSTYTAVQVKVRGVTDPTAGYDLAVSGTGSAAGEVLPTQIAALVNWRTAKFGRSFMGKTYIPAIAETAVASGSIVAGQITLIETWAAVMELLAGTDPITASFEHGVYSELLAEFHPRTSFFVSQFAATQRRRKPGVGA
jgi:hypothetical protein